MIRVCAAQELLILRRDVLRPGMDLSIAINKGDDDATTFHIAEFEEDTPVSCASFYLETHPKLIQLAAPQYRLRGMATSESHRNKGLGAKLLAAAEPILREKGCLTLWCNARVRAVSFYRRFGMQIDGGEFEIPGVGMHFLMWKAIDAFAFTRSS